MSSSRRSRQALLGRIGPALGDVAGALDGVARFRGSPSWLLRVNLPRVANQLVIAPVIGRFLAAYPEVGLEIASAGRPGRHRGGRVRRRHPPRDLGAHRCIEQRYPDGSCHAWEVARGDEAAELEVSRSLVADDTALMLRAAVDGIGLAFVFEELSADALADGRLVRVLEDWCPMRPRFFLHHPGQRHVSPALRALIDAVRTGGSG